MKNKPEKSKDISEKINAELKNIEELYQVKFLYACES